LSSYVLSEVAKTAEVMQLIRADQALIDTVERVGAACAKSIAGGGKVMFCGNGGSAGDSQHLAAELVGKLMFNRPGMSGLSLTVDTSALTAIGNDFGYEHIFSRQVEALGRSGDVLVGDLHFGTLQECGECYGGSTGGRHCHRRHDGREARPRVRIG